MRSLPFDFGIRFSSTGGGNHVPEHSRFQILYRLPSRCWSNFFKVGNDSNLLIVFYVQIMPMTLSCSSTDFENDSDFRPSRARCCLRFRLCRSIRCVYRLLITCSFPFRRDSYSGQPSVIHITTSKGDSRLIRRPSVAIVRSPNTCATTVFRRLSYA